MNYQSSRGFVFCLRIPRAPVTRYGFSRKRIARQRSLCCQRNIDRKGELVSYDTKTLKITKQANGHKRHWLFFCLSRRVSRCSRFSPRSFRCELGNIRPPREVPFSNTVMVSLEIWDSVCPLWHVAEGRIVSCLGGLDMARGRKTSLSIRLTPAQRRTLLRWQHSTALAAGCVRRGRIILLVADGMPITDIAATVGISRRFVYKWVQRFVEKGVAGLATKSARGHRRTASTPALAEPHAVSA